MTVISRIDGWVFTPEAAGRVRVLRIGIAALISVRLATGAYRGLADQPDALFRPVWLLAWLDRMPPAEALVAIQLVGSAAAVLAVAGWRERGTFAAAWLSLLVLSGLHASRGKVEHNDLTLLLVAGVLACAPVGARALDVRRSARWGWPVRTSLLVVLGAYFLTGFQKLVSSGPAWVLSDNLRNIMYGARFTGHAPTSLAFWIAERPAIAHLVALAALTIELGAVVALVRPRMRPWYLGAITVLHIGIWFTHGLNYTMWIGTATVVLIDWQAVLLRARTRASL